MQMYAEAAFLIPLLPLAAYLILMALGRGSHTAGVWVGTGGAAASLLLSLLVWIERFRKGAVDYNDSFNWISIDRITLRIGFEVTNMSALLLVGVSLLSVLVHIYAAGYMKRDERLTVFYSYMSLFTFSLLALSLADNVLAFYLFWELASVSLFLLFGFWYAKSTARAAAKRAFIMLRLASAGLLLATLLLFWFMPEHALDFAAIHNVFEGQSGAIAKNITTLIASLLLLGAVGMAAQFPLYAWLSNAEQAPAPASALLQGAGMMTGALLLSKTTEIFQSAPAVTEAALYIGVVTAVYAAVRALMERDIKKVLIYSTISQLGVVQLSLALGAATSSMLYVLVHAICKTLLVLAAGHLLRTVGTADIGAMGGLRKHMPLAAWTFLIGGLALCGLPPLTGFWLQQSIWAEASEQHILWLAAIMLVLFLTAAYMSRMYFLIFEGKPRSAAAGIPEQGQKPSRLMSYSVVILAAIVVLSGFFQLVWGSLPEHWLDGDAAGRQGSMSLGLMLAAVAILLGGIWLGWLKNKRDASALLSNGNKLKDASAGWVADKASAIKRSFAVAGAALAAIEQAMGALPKLAAQLLYALGRLAVSFSLRSTIRGMGLAIILGLVITIIIMAAKGEW
ncbi:NADH-quinone oxidoreductase subunit L [Paenibacillus algorifonticola]|uniref:NADH-quinone oxidoreductase subunit L n=1 Tax=Paenibacillus algorifonticola TaxID=684063 RepID=A0A1I2GED8_9BACL|nr:proton-conducting transporter membrane subunit [Paenibacillus algorifonticola]SFF15449.1 NADH-quinone oxidoreductase subunit L [Paenibacillus algorifonticola]